MNFAVALGAAVGTAVLTGALLVGDSMRGSLRSLALDRLGKIDEVLAPGRFFREKLAEELKATDDFKKYGDSLVPAILLPASLDNPNSHHRANRAQVIGCNDDFADLFLPAPFGGHHEVVGAGGEGLTEKSPTDAFSPNSPHPNPLPKGEGIASIFLNQPLAEKLAVHPGDEVILRLPRPGMIPSDSPLGEKRDTVRSFRLTVKKILPADGQGRFSLAPNQQDPLNAFVPLDWLQERLDQSGRVNMLLLSLNDAGKKVVAKALNPPKQESSLNFYVSYDSVSDFLFGVRHYIHYSGDDVIYYPSSGLGLRDPKRNLAVKLEDAGIRLEVSPAGYLNVTSDRMLLQPAVEDAICLPQIGYRYPRGEFTLQPVFTYLANSITDGDRTIPYSTIAAADFGGDSEADIPVDHFVVVEGKSIADLGPDEVALNDWATGDLGAKIGDTIEIAYFDPESVHGQIRERTAKFKLASIVRIAGTAADRKLTPSVKGITDELTMANWDPPFPFDAKRIRPRDEKYWNEYGPTPKAFISLFAGRKLWSSRFGDSTSLRIIPNDDNQLKAKNDLIELERQLDEKRFYFPSLGFVWQPVKLQGIAASEGTTPFNVLFLGFSFFIIASALMLVLLLFKLGVERRAAEIGILLAVGWTPGRVRKLLFREGVLTALCGGLAGVPLGIGYAALMLWGLQTWWIAAISAPFLKLFITSGSLSIGFFAGFFMALATIFFAVRKISRVAPRRLLAGQIEPESRFKGSYHRLRSKRARRVVGWLDVLWVIFLSLNIILWFFARNLGDAEAGAFFGGGAAMLVLTLLAIWSRLRRGATGAAVAEGGGNLFRLAMRNAARNPGRSTLTVGLVASTSFLIAAVSAFRLDPSQQTPSLESGNGGFALTAESSQPIFQNLDAPEGRAELGFSDDEEMLLADCRIYSLRVRAGDDASCLNLYKPRSPRLLGLPESFLKRGGFAWADTPTKCENPWRLLAGATAGSSSSAAPLEKNGTAGQASSGTPDETPLPMILEKNTANYSLNLWGGLGEVYEYRDSFGKEFSLQTAALLDNSIFQGDLLVSEEALLEKYPETGGYRFFAIECPAEKAGDVQKLLENRLGDYGFSAEATGRRLARFLAVQNTYLSTFQSLGGLGLLLGTLGLAAVQLRNVIERRGELALLRAVGFTRKRLALLVLLENTVLLAFGLSSGILAATVAVMPFLSTNAKIPWLSLTGLLALVFIVGMLAGIAAARQSLKAPLLKSLREDR
jgi:ABC-type antimicrobial peptide transport system permease subunit